MCLEELSPEVWTLVLGHLGLRDCTSCLTLSSGVRRALLNESIWKHLCLDLFRDLSLRDPADWLNPRYKAELPWNSHLCPTTYRGVYLLARHYQRICGFWTTSRCCEWNGEVIPEATIVRFRLVPQGLEIDGFRVMQGPMRRQQWGCIHPGKGRKGLEFSLPDDGSRILARIVSVPQTHANHMAGVGDPDFDAAYSAYVQSTMQTSSRRRSRGTKEWGENADVCLYGLRVPGAVQGPAEDRPLAGLWMAEGYGPHMWAITYRDHARVLRLEEVVRCDEELSHLPRVHEYRVTPGPALADAGAGHEADVEHFLRHGLVPEGVLPALGSQGWLRLVAQDHMRQVVPNYVPGRLYRLPMEACGMRVR